MKTTALSFISVIVAVMTLSETKCASQNYTSGVSLSSAPVSWIVSPDKQSPSYLRHRVITIYKQVITNLNNESECGCGYQYDIDQYKSAAFKKIEKKCEALAENGDKPYWYKDSADWILTQDMENPRLVSVTVSDIKDNKAKARVILDVFGNSDIMQHIDLWMVYENGDWFINDFQDDTMRDVKKTTLKTEMIQFFRNHFLS